MTDVAKLESMFFSDLKKYNTTNFKKLVNADLSQGNAEAHKAFSSVVTRYFIFREKHAGELPDSEFNLLYFNLKIDLISQYFAEYPNSDMSSLEEFQQKIKSYLALSKEEGKRETVAA